MCDFISAPNVAMGWGCCRCRVYNGIQRPVCKSCGVAYHDPLTIRDDSKFGTYEEEGGKTRVEVLGVELDEKGVGVRLRAIKSLQSSPMVNDIPSGEEWRSWVAHNAGAYGGGWRLTCEQPST